LPDNELTPEQAEELYQAVDEVASSIRSLNDAKKYAHNYRQESERFAKLAEQYEAKMSEHLVAVRNTAAKFKYLLPDQPPAEEEPAPAPAVREPVIGEELKRGLD
jgi:hypothetical protein